MIERGQGRGAAGEVLSYDLHCPDTDGPHPLLVILHGFKGFKDWGFFPHAAERLCSAGLAALRLNFSHNGVGLQDEATSFTRLDLFARNRPRFERADLAAVLRALDAPKALNSQGSDASELEFPPALRARLDLERVGILGHSRGGPIAILAGAERNCPVVTWNSVPSLAFREDQVRAFTRDGCLRVPNARTGQIMEIAGEVFEEMHPLPREYELGPALRSLGDRLLAIHGTADQSVPPSALETLRRDSGDRARTLRVADADHVFGARHPFAGTTPGLEAAIAATLEHFQRFWR